MYEVGELSMMMVSRRSRPTWERSWKCQLGDMYGTSRTATYFHIVALMIVATFAEKPVVDYFVNVKLVQ